MLPTRTFEDATAAAPKLRTFEVAVGTPRYAQNVREIVARTGELQKNTQAQQTYIRDYWKQQGAALAKSDAAFRDDPIRATTHLLQTVGRETIDQVQAAKSKEWQTVAKDKAVREFFSKRKQLANALWNQVHLSDPEIPDEDAYQHMHQQLALYGYQPPGAGKLPPLVMRDGQLENEYTWGWTEFRSFTKGIATGAKRLVEAPQKIGTMVGEAVHDHIHQDVMGAEITGSNVYRDIRERMQISSEQIDEYLGRGIGKIDYLPEGFNIYEIMGEQVPQFALMAGTGQKVAQGLVTKFMGRTATAASMFCLETADAYEQYMKYAADKDMDPRTASQIAAGGAVVYGAISSVLESYGPFELLSRKNPKAFGRITRGAIMSLAEGGTEFTQAMTQHAIAAGLDLKEMDWDSIRSAMGEAVAGMIMGGAMGVTLPGGTAGTGRTSAPPQIAGPGMNIDPGERGPITEVVETPIITPEVTPDITPEVEIPQTLTREQIVDQMVEATPEAERTSVTRAAFEANLMTFQHGGGPFVEVEVPVADLDILQVTEEKLGPKVGEYAARPAEEALAIVAGTTAPGGRLTVIDGVHRVRAAQQRGDATIKTLIPQADAEAVIPPVEITPPVAEITPPVAEEVAEAPSFEAWIEDQAEVTMQDLMEDPALRYEYEQEYQKQQVPTAVETPVEVAEPPTVHLPDTVSRGGGFLALPGTFLRFGTPPAGPSTNYFTGKPEKGLSVVSAWRDPRTGKYVLETGGEQLITSIGEMSDRHVYEMSGSQLEDVGADGEPLLDHTSTKILQEVSLDDIVTGDDPYITLLGKELVEAEIPVWDQPSFFEQPTSRELRWTPTSPYAVGATVSTPVGTYAEACAKQREGDAKTGQNIWVRESETEHNENRILCIQFSSDLLQTGERTNMDDYMDEVYHTRPGYVRPDDFWEVPQWIAQAALIHPNADMYVVRDVAEAQAFLREAEYEDVAFSVLDVNKSKVRELTQGYTGTVTLGGYVDLKTFSKTLDLTEGSDVYVSDMKNWAKRHGQKYTEGADYRHFKSTRTIPRLTMSEGCRHSCKFCIVPNKVQTKSKETIVQQITSMIENLDARLIYLNDKTFGQAPNYTELIDIYDQVKKAHPEFGGFIIQTTALQMKKLSGEFLRRAGIKYIEIGVESFNNEILKDMNKPATRESIMEAVAKCRENNIALIPNVMIGLPGETMETYQNTMEFLEENQDIISHVNAYNLALYQDSKLGQEKGIEQTEIALDENQIRGETEQEQVTNQWFSDELARFGHDVVAAEAIAEPRILPPPPEFVTKTVSRVQERLGRRGAKITDQASLARVGNVIAELVGIDQDIDWVFTTDPNLIGTAGTHWRTGPQQHKIRIRAGTKYRKGAVITEKIARRKAQAGMKVGQIMPSQTNIYRVIVHELGHIAAPPVRGEAPISSRKVHHQEFVDWVEEGVTKLIGTTYVQAPEVDPLISPANVPLSEDMAPVSEQARSFLQDENGFWDPQTTGRIIEGGITVATEGAGSILTGVTALTDEAAFLHRTNAGTLADELFSDAQAKAQSKIGEHNSEFLTAYDKLTTEEKRWLEHIREDGQTNWATLREHPDRLDADAIPRNVITLAQVAQAQQTDSAQGAIDARLPQARMEEVVGPRGGKILKRIIGIFKPAKEGRYYRILAPKGAAAIHSQSGLIFDALIEWLETHADRNPNLPDTAADIREKLAGERASGKTRQAGSLEYTRVFKELPTALMINDKWEALQEMRPVNHFMSSNESQWRRITFWDVIQERLLPRYGKFDEETGETTLPHPQNKTLTDVDGLVDRLRKDVVQQEGRRHKGNPKGAEQSYNRMLEHYFRQFSGGVMEEVFTLGDRDNRLMQVASIVDRNIMSSILSFSGLWDVCQPTASAHIVGYRRLTKAYAKVMAEVLAHPTKYAAEYQAMGAVSLRHHDYILRKTRRELTSGVLERTLPQAMMWGAEAMEQWSQTVTATAFDLWLRDVNGDLKDADARMLRKHLRLTDVEVLEVAQGKVSDQTRAKVIQNGVKTTNYLAEDPMHRGLLQNVPLLRFMVPFTSVVSGNLRAAGRVVTDIVDDVKRIKTGDKVAVKDLLKDLSKMMAFLVACFGRGFVQNMMRRAITGKPLLRPEEEDDWAGTLFDCLGEGAVFGPYYRLLEAAKYSGGDPSRMAVNMLPRAAIWIEMISALGGIGQYEETAWGKRMEKWGYKVSPTARSFKNWYNKMLYPGRAEYKEIRQRVRLFLEAEGEEPKRGFGPTNRYYYAVFEAVRDQNDVALDKALVKYKEWAKAKGKTSEEARTALRSALYARRPMNLREERVQKFLARLSDTQREMAEQQQRDYTAWLDRVTRRPGVKRRRKTKAKRTRKVIGGDWYGTD